MKLMTIRLPEKLKPRLDALAKRAGRTPAEYARAKLIEAVENEEKLRHRAAMREMVRQAVAHGEDRDEYLEAAALEAIQ